MNEAIGFIFIVTLISGSFYKPVRILVADLLFSIGCFFGCFLEFFKAASHDVRNFEPSWTAKPNLTLGEHID